MSGYNRIDNEPKVETYNPPVPAGPLPQNSNTLSNEPLLSNNNQPPQVNEQYPPQAYPYPPQAYPPAQYQQYPPQAYPPMPYPPEGMYQQYPQQSYPSQQGYSQGTHTVERNVEVSSVTVDNNAIFKEEMNKRRNNRIIARICVAFMCCVVFIAMTVSISVFSTV